MCENIARNVAFQEEYKRLDTLCKDIFSSEVGVNQYISEMENSRSLFRSNVPSWELKIRQLKQMRSLRNQLSHEVGAFQSDLCSESDVNWLKDFRNAILHGTDPLAIVGRAERERKAQRKKIPTYNFNNSTRRTEKEEPKQSFWDKLKEKIKNLFC